MFKPNYMNIVNAALNKKSDRIPLYEHNISPTFMERITGTRFAHLHNGSYSDKLEFFKQYNAFQRDMGYDAVTYEACTGGVLPDGGALGGGKKGIIQTREDFERYPWDKIPDYFFKEYSEHFLALRETMPEGMKAIGGVGNGIFECVQDLVGFEDLCYMKVDDEDLYQDMFKAVGEVLYRIWERFLPEFGDIYCVCRFGDDLGFKSSTLLWADDVKEYIVPQYKRIIELIHSYDKPFLLHSCGCIFEVMEDIIEVAKIDAKHSNEDVISPYEKWIDDYGNRIGNFGGLDTDALCDLNQCDIVSYATHVYEICNKKGKGVAIGSGNSIPDYVSVSRYTKAIETLRKLRGE